MGTLTPRLRSSFFSAMISWTTIELSLFFRKATQSRYRMALFVATFCALAFHTASRILREFSNPSVGRFLLFCMSQLLYLNVYPRIVCHSLLLRFKAIQT